MKPSCMFECYSWWGYRRPYLPDKPAKPTTYFILSSSTIRMAKGKHTTHFLIHQRAGSSFSRRWKFQVEVAVTSYSDIRRFSSCGCWRYDRRSLNWPGDFYLNLLRLCSNLMDHNAQYVIQYVIYVICNM